MKAAQLLEICIQNGWTLTCAESCTGGLLAGALTEVPGSSEAFVCGFVVYSNQAKMTLLDVDERALRSCGAVSQQVAEEMARSALVKAGADIAASITGVAGPGASEHKPEGRVWFGAAASDGSASSEVVEFGPLGRAEVRRRSVDHALSMLLANARARAGDYV